MGNMKEKSKLDMLNGMWNDIKLTIMEILLSIMFIVPIIVGYNSMNRITLILVSMSASVFMVLSIMSFVFAFNKFSQLYKEMKEDEKYEKKDEDR